MTSCRAKTTSRRVFVRDLSRLLRRSGFALGAVLSASVVGAGEADVVAVNVRRAEGGRCQFEVTVRHADEGWNHYADRWEVVAADGTTLATRVLQHPHADEQPFTRSLSGVEIPAGARRVSVRVHDSVHEFGGKEVTVEVPQEGGHGAATRGGPERRE